MNPGSANADDDTNDDTNDARNDEEVNERRRMLPPAPAAHAVDLATLLSTTVRVEPELMRAVRVALLPQADVGAESDLWFSEWAATRSARALVLRLDVQRALRPRLPEVLARCASPPGIAPADRLRDLITGCHRHLSPLMRIEEEVLWLLSRDEGDGAGVRRAEEALRSVLRALVEERGREAIADWIVTVARRLPPRLGRTVTGWQFRSIASFLEPDTTVGEDAPAHIDCRDAALVVRAVAASGEAEVPDTRIAVRPVGDALHIGGDGQGEPDTLLISVPATDPVVLELRTGTDGRARPLHVSPDERVTVPGCTIATRLVAANGHVYDPFGALRSPSSGHASSPDPPPTVFLNSASLDSFSRKVRDQVDARLRRLGYDVRDLGALWPARHRRGDAPATWPERMDAVVFLLDRELLGSAVVHDQIEILNAWAARSGAPRPVLVPLRDLLHADRERLARRVGAESRQWVTAVVSRPWPKDQPWGDGHAREVAERAVRHAVGGGPASTGQGAGSFPTRYQLLARVLEKYLRRYAADGDRGVLERAAALFSPDPEAPLPADEAAVPAFVLLARARRQLARLTGSVDEAYGAVRLLRRVLTRAPSAAGPPAERGAAPSLGQAVGELLRAWSDWLDLTEGSRLPDRAVAGLDEAVRLGRELLRTDPGPLPRLELTACLARVAANDAWLRRHPQETRAAALLNLDAADAARPGPHADRIAAARTAARLAIAADAMPLAVRAHDRWFALLERTDWERLDRVGFHAVTESVAGAAENAAACALAAGEPPAEAVRLLERGLAVHRVVLAARSLYGHHAGSCQPEWRRRSRLRRELSRISAHSADGAPRVTGDEGPVAVLLAADVGGAALILDGGAVTAVAVPGLTAATARGWSPGDPDLREALRPVVQELERGARGGDASGPRRLFWCPTGPLSRLPVHEAWSPERGGADAVPSYVSSPAEFPGAAVPAGPGEVSATRARPVVVVSPGAGDAAWTARAEAEVRAIRGTGMEFDLLAGDQATRLAVLEAASDVEVVHLVGRPVPHPDGGWAIALADGPLTGTDIAAADLSRTRLAVLSAYGESVGAGSEPDWDTLAGGLRRAGCRHVVTSLAPPGTSARGVDALVTRFYDALLDRDRLPRPDLAPFALHRASTAVHQPGRDRPPYHLVHIGT
ncbi:CHAT domain-containing protein [Streptomyces sp. NPDC049687]|uniref:CHAT domain-containing protein n=1 Tax=Streptomyces sp. NPDC049687 TaxID=3365596 RepID=UPI0037A989F6